MFGSRLKSGLPVRIPRTAQPVFSSGTPVLACICHLFLFGVSVALLSVMAPEQHAPMLHRSFATTRREDFGGDGRQKTKKKDASMQCTGASRSLQPGRPSDDALAFLGSKWRNGTFSPATINCHQLNGRKVKPRAPRRPETPSQARRRARLAIPAPPLQGTSG